MTCRHLTLTGLPNGLGIVALIRRRPTPGHLADQPPGLKEPTRYSLS
jgi:hypothetical protein